MLTLLSCLKVVKPLFTQRGHVDISTFENSVDFGVFSPTVVNKGDECYISDHTDLGMGLNTKSEKMLQQ